MLPRKPVSFSLILGQWYIYHPKTDEEENLNNIHLLYSGLGCGIDVNLDFMVPFAVRCTLLGGAAIGIINNEMYIEPVVLINPGIAAQVGIIYSLSDVLALLVKA